jgi:uncharacterized protein
METTQDQVERSSLDGQVILDPFEIRVLAVLAEKEALTPDNYPLSLNALINGCNQLTSRDTVMSLSDETVLDVLQRLMKMKFVVEVNQAGARVSKYEHRMRVKWSLEQDKLAVLTMLMLRGIQTAGEIRTRCGRLYDFSSIAQVETCLEFLIDKYPPLVARIARLPGTKEPRYAHLLSGEQVLEQQEVAAGFSADATVSSTPRQDRVTALEAEVQRLRDEVALLAQQFESFKKQFE